MPHQLQTYADIVRSISPFKIRMIHKHIIPFNISNTKCKQCQHMTLRAISNHIIQIAYEHALNIEHCALSIKHTTQIIIIIIILRVTVRITKCRIAIVALHNSYIS